MDLPPPKNEELLAGLTFKPEHKRLIVKCNVNEALEMDPESLIKVFTQKPPTCTTNEFDSKNTLVGFNPANLVLDGVQSSLMSQFTKHSTQHQHKHSSSDRNNSPPKKLNNVLLGSDVGKKDVQHLDVPGGQIDQGQGARSYTALIDQHALHNFIIHNGKAVRTTPEFVSFHRCYRDQWEGILNIIHELEHLMLNQGVKLAVITGLKVFELFEQNLPEHTPHDLIGTVSNIDQVMPQMTSLFGAGVGSRVFKAVVIIQTRVRIQQAIIKMRTRLRNKNAAIVIQTSMRRALAHMHVLRELKRLRANIQSHWTTDNLRLLGKFQRGMKSLYESNSHSPSGHQHLVYTQLEIQAINKINSIPIDVKGRPLKRFPSSEVIKKGLLLVHISTLSALEFARLNLNNMTAMQNAHIACLHQLADPLVTMVIIAPTPVTPLELNYHSKLLDMLELPAHAIDRVHFICPEITEQLPRHLPLSAQLWYSSEALVRLRQFTRKFKHVLVIPSAVTWVEKKLGYFLKCPFMCPDPTVADTITSKSFLKSAFVEAKVNIPVGAHDIHTEDDILIALARLIASNLDVNIWLLRLNYDCNNESMCTINVGKMPFVLSLREEQISMQRSHGEDSQYWYGRNLQVAVRKRILKALQAVGVFPYTKYDQKYNPLATPGTKAQKQAQMTSDGLPTSVIQFGRPDIFTSWSYYSGLLRIHGGLIEAEPPGDILGYLRCVAHINPGVYVPGASTDSKPSTVESGRGNPVPRPDPLQMSPEEYNAYLTKQQREHEQLENLHGPQVGMTGSFENGDGAGDNDSDPVDVRVLGGAELLMDEHYQYQGCCFPQRQIPQEALFGATAALCNVLYKKYRVIGYVEVNFVVFWDDFENIPKMWGLEYSFGCSYMVNCASIMNRVTYMAAQDKQLNMNRAHLVSSGIASGGSANSPGPDHSSEYLTYLRNNSLIGAPSFEGRCCIYVPVAIHSMLQGTRDDVFFKLCAMHNVTYDSVKRIGTLFFLTDSIVGSGTLSMMCISSTRRKTLELVQTVTQFIFHHFSKEHPTSVGNLYAPKHTTKPIIAWDNLRSVVNKIKTLMKQPKSNHKDAN